MQLPIKARYIGYTKNTENLGDEALMTIIRDLLAPEIEVVFEDDPDVSLALLGGGTLINQSPWLIDVFAKALRHSGGRGAVFGTGVGDLAFWGNQFHRWAPLLNQCALVGVRGPESKRLLVQHGIPHAECIGDPYLMITSPTPGGVTSHLIAVNLGSTNNSLWGDNDAEYLNFMEGVLKTLASQGASFEWISVWSRDLPLLQEMKKRVEPDSPPVRDARTQQHKVLEILTHCELMIGEKLHALAMGAVAGTPFIALEYQPKVRDFAESLNMEEWTISTAMRRASTLTAKIDELRRQRDSASQHMLAARRVLQEQNANFSRRIKSRFADGG